MGYSKSNFELTKMLVGSVKWGADEMESRGRELSDTVAIVGEPQAQIRVRAAVTGGDRRESVTVRAVIKT